MFSAVQNTRSKPEPGLILSLFKLIHEGKELLPLSEAQNVALGFFF